MATIHSRRTRREMLSGMAKLAGATLLSRRLLLGGNATSAAHYAPKLSVEVYIWTQQLASEKKTLAEGVDEVLAYYTKYRDTPCDFADACLIYLADQFGTGDILTLDSDFKHYRWRRNKRFGMLIPLE